MVRIPVAKLISQLRGKNDRKNQEGAEVAVARVTELGKLPIDNQHVRENVLVILKMMAKFPNHLALQRTACHSLSNMAMEIPNAEWIMQNGGFEAIFKALDIHIKDWKLCWLACSSVWNLARPPQARERIGTRGVNMIFRVMQQHCKQARVINTALGALSNLSLFGTLKLHMGTPKSIGILMTSMKHHFKSRQVLTSGCGLLANLAVFDDIADVLVAHDTVQFLIGVVKVALKEELETMRRNVSAALSNLTSSEAFTSALLQSSGAEILFTAVQAFQAVGVQSLLENCLTRISANVHHPTYSIHLASKLGLMATVHAILTEGLSFDINHRDSQDRTPLDYALDANRAEVVQLLVACGGAYTSSQFPPDRVPAELQQRINRGRAAANVVKTAYTDVVASSQPALPRDVCQLLVTFGDKYEMLQALTSEVVDAEMEDAE